MCTFLRRALEFLKRIDESWRVGIEEGTKVVI